MITISVDYAKNLDKVDMLEKFKSQLSGQLDRPLSVDCWNSIDADLKYAISLLAASLSKLPFVIIEEYVIRSLDDKSQSHFLELLSEKVLMILYGSVTSSVGVYNENLVMIVSNSEVVGMGNLSWFEQYREDIVACVDDSTRVQSQPLPSNDLLSEYDI